MNLTHCIVYSVQIPKLEVAYGLHKTSVTSIKFFVHIKAVNI